MSKLHTRLNGRLLLAVLAFLLLGVAGDLTLKHAMRQIPPPAEFSLPEIGRVAAYVGSSLQVKAGIMLLALNFAMLLAVLSCMELSVVGPARALSYLFLTVMASVVLHERVPPQRWAGVALITIGVAVILSTARSAKPGQAPADSSGREPHGVRA